MNLMCEHGYENWEQFCLQCWKEKAEELKHELSNLQTYTKTIEDELKDLASAGQFGSPVTLGPESSNQYRTELLKEFEKSK